MFSASVLAGATPRHVYLAGPDDEVLAVKESVMAAQRSAGQIARVKRIPISVWATDARLRPGARIPVENAVYVADSGHDIRRDYS